MPATVGLRRPPRAVVVAGEPHHCGEERISPGGLGGGGYSILSILGLAWHHPRCEIREMRHAFEISTFVAETWQKAQGSILIHSSLTGPETV